MVSLANIIKKIVVAVVGLPLLLIGIILIPLPGPGILISFLALFILSLEFKVFRKYFDMAKNKLQHIINQAKVKYEEIDKKTK